MDDPDAPRTLDYHTLPTRPGPRPGGPASGAGVVLLSLALSWGPVGFVAGLVARIVEEETMPRPPGSSTPYPGSPAPLVAGLIAWAITGGLGTVVSVVLAIRNNNRAVGPSIDSPDERPR